MPADKKLQYRLPKQIDALLAAAANQLKNEGRNDLVAALVNARPEVIEDADDNGWGNATGHDLLLHIPEALHAAVISDDESNNSKLERILNKIANVSNEYFSNVKICLDLETISPNWRAETGALLAPPTLTTSSSIDQERLWGSKAPRVFLSHRSDFKIAAKQLKDELGKYGAASFVAHEDIEPTRKWQIEIERALATMDVLVAVLSEGFAQSHWTNQEVGIALGRGIPVIALRIAEDPKGFMGSSQAVSGRDKLAMEWAKKLTDAFSMHAPLRRLLLSSFVSQWEAASSYSDAMRVMGLLDTYQEIPIDLLDRIETAYRVNDQLYGSNAVGRKYPDFIKRIKAAIKSTNLSPF